MYVSLLDNDNLIEYTYKILIIVNNKKINIIYIFKENYCKNICI